MLGLSRKNIISIIQSNISLIVKRLTCINQRKLTLINTVLISIFLISSNSFAQRINLGKVLFLGGDSCHAICYDVLEDNGDIVYTGESNCNAKGDIPSTPYGGFNIVIGKLDSNFNKKWIKTFGGNKDDKGVSICKAIDGGYCTVSTTASPDGDISGFYGTTDLFVMRLNDDGDIIWKKNYGGPASEEALSIVPTPDSGYAILGVTNGAGDDISFQYSPSQFVMDWVLIKIDKNGNKEWVKVLGGKGDEYDQGKLLYLNNNFYLVGGSESTDFECNDNSWHGSKKTSYNYYVLKLDNSGNLIWSKSFGGSSSEVPDDAILDEADGSIVIVGQASSKDYFVSNNYGDEDVWLVKVDTNGNYIWGKVYGGSRTEIFMSVSTIQYGYAFYTSTYSNNAVGGTDGWLFFVDKNGNKICDKPIIGNRSEDRGYIIPYNGNFVISGETNSDSFSDGVKTGNTGFGEDIYFGKVFFFPTAVDATKKEVSKNFKVYPNPANTNLFIEVKPKDQPGIAKIYDKVGRCVFSKTCNEIRTRQTIDISYLVEGDYYITWQSKVGIVYGLKFQKI